MQPKSFQNCTVYHKHLHLGSYEVGASKAHMVHNGRVNDGWNLTHFLE